MDAARYARLKSLFEEVLRLHGGEREAFLARTGHDEPDLGRELAELVRHHEAARDFLAERPAEGAPERPLPSLAVPGFRIQRELGRGGMGIVLLAEQEQPRRPVALKFLRLDSLAEADVERFRREAEILGRLHHPGIAHVHGAGTVPTEQGELPWIAMEYVHGEPLHEHVARRAFDLRGLIELFASLCDALQHAHERGVVHRDLKPSNVLVDERGAVRVVDFGVARLVGGAAGGGPRTRTGQMVGTLAYASPEQACGRNEEVDARTDVYALGVMLHELLTGELPYPIDEARVVEALRAICDEEPRRVRRRRPDAPGDLESVLRKALAKERALRYADAGELAADLRCVLAERPVAARAPSALYQTRKFVRRNRALTVSTLTVILALAATVGVLLASRRNDHEQVARVLALLDLTAREVFRLVPEMGFDQDYRDTLETLDASLAQELARTPGQRNLRGHRARSLYELAALDQAAGALALAGQRFEGARVMREGLAREEVSDLESRTHLSQIYARLGELARASGDPLGERAWFERAFELDQELVRAHPGDGELLEDLGWSLERMADLALRRGERAEAERLVRWRLADAERLLEQDDRDPDHWKFLYNAAQAHNCAANLAGAQAPEASARHSAEVLRLARRLHELQPRRAVFQRLWAGANRREALRAGEAGRWRDALRYAEIAFGQGMQLFVNDPRSRDYATFLVQAAWSLFLAQRQEGLGAQAGTTPERLRAAAVLAGEDSPSGMLLLATAESLDLELQTSPEARQTVLERALRRYEALFASCDVAELGEVVRHNLGSDSEVARELGRRLQAADESRGRVWIAALGLDASRALEPAGDPPVGRR